MKTPREVLLQHHRAAEPKLDAIRQSTVAAVCDRRTSTDYFHDRWSQTAATKQSFPASLVALSLRCSNKLWRELVWPCRRTWAGLAATWLLLLAFNLTHAEHGQSVIAKSAIPSAEVRIAFQEQQRLLTELIGSTPPALPAEPPRRPNNQPRSERTTTLLTV